MWGNIAEGRGVGLVVRSLEPQIPREVRLVPLRQRAHLAVDLVWPDDPVSPAIERFRELARGVSDAHGWLRDGRPTDPTG